MQDVILREFCDRRISRLEESRFFALLRMTDSEVFRMTPIRNSFYSLFLIAGNNSNFPHETHIGYNDNVMLTINIRTLV